jgi:hypothetical protein
VLGGAARRKQLQLASAEVLWSFGVTIKWPEYLGV